MVVEGVKQWRSIPATVDAQQSTGGGGPSPEEPKRKGGRWYSSSTRPIK